MKCPIPVTEENLQWVFWCILILGKLECISLLVSMFVSIAKSTKGVLNEEDVYDGSSGQKWIFDAVKNYLEKEGIDWIAIESDVIRGQTRLDIQMIFGTATKRGVIVFENKFIRHDNSVEILDGLLQIFLNNSYLRALQTLEEDVTVYCVELFFLKKDNKFYAIPTATISLSKAGVMKCAALNVVYHRRRMLLYTLFHWLTTKKLIFGDLKYFQTLFQPSAEDNPVSDSSADNATQHSCLWFTNINFEKLFLLPEIIEKPTPTLPTVSSLFNDLKREYKKVLKEAKNQPGINKNKIDFVTPCARFQASTFMPSICPKSNPDTFLSNFPKIFVCSLPFAFKHLSLDDFRYHLTLLFNNYGVQEYVAKKDDWVVKRRKDIKAKVMVDMPWEFLIVPFKKENSTTNLCFILPQRKKDYYEYLLGSLGYMLLNFLSDAQLCHSLAIPECQFFCVTEVATCNWYASKCNDLLVKNSQSSKSHVQQQPVYSLQLMVSGQQKRLKKIENFDNDDWKKTVDYVCNSLDIDTLVTSTKPKDNVSDKRLASDGNRRSESNRPGSSASSSMAQSMTWSFTGLEEDDSDNDDLPPKVKRAFTWQERVNRFLNDPDLIQTFIH